MRVAQPRNGEPIRLVFTKTGLPRYRVTLDAEQSTGGRRRQLRFTRSTLTQARELVAAHRTDLERGVLRSPDEQTFDQYAIETWLSRRERSPRVREKTVRGYRGALKQASSAFGSKRMDKVARADVELLVDSLVRAGRAASTVTLALFVIRSVFAEALDEGLVRRNPAAQIRPAGRKAFARPALTIEQIQRLRAHLQTDPRYACWLLTLYGLRRSEVMGLRWTDCDMRSGLLTIARGRVLVDGHRTVVGQPKTERARRVLPMPADLVRALHALRDKQTEQFGTKQALVGYLAIDELGEPMRPERWSDLWRRHCRAAGVPDVTLHAARHSSVTAMRDLRVPDHIVAAWHGHDEYVMRRTYTHAQPEHLSAAAAALSSALRVPAAGQL